MSYPLRFFLSLTLIALLIVAAYSTGITSRPSYFYQIIVFLFITTCALFYYLLQTKLKRPGIFVQFYLLTMAVKLLAYVGFLIFVISRNRSEGPANVVLFIIVYFLFTTVEVAFLYRKVNG